MAHVRVGSVSSKSLYPSLELKRLSRRGTISPILLSTAEDTWRSRWFAGLWIACGVICTAPTLRVGPCSYRGSPDHISPPLFCASAVHGLFLLYLLEGFERDGIPVSQAISRSKRDGQIAMCARLSKSVCIGEDFSGASTRRRRISRCMYRF